MKKSQLKEIIKSLLKEDNKQGSVKLKKGTPDSEIKKYTTKGIDVELNETSDIKDMKLSQVMKLVKDGGWETDTDIVPYKHVILKNRISGKQKVVNVRPDKVTEGNFIKTEKSNNLNEDRDHALLFDYHGNKIELTDAGDLWVNGIRIRYNHGTIAIGVKIPVSGRGLLKPVGNSNVINGIVYSNKLQDFIDTLLETQDLDTAINNFKSDRHGIYVMSKIGLLNKNNLKETKDSGKIKIKKSELKETSENIKQEIIKLYKKGISQHDIATKYNYDFDTVVSVTKYLGHGSWYNDDDIDDRLGDDPMSKQYYDRTLTENSDFNGSGLIVVGKTQIDNNKIQDLINDEEYHAIWNSKEGYWFFPEEESTLDQLEADLEAEFYRYEIDARFESQLDESKRIINPVVMQQMIKHTKDSGKTKMKKSELKEIIKKTLSEENNTDSIDKKLKEWTFNDSYHIEMIDSGHGEFPNRYRLTQKGIETIKSFFNPSDNITEQEDEEVEDNWNKVETDDTPSDSDLDKQALRNAKASKGKGKKLDFIIKELEALKKEMISMVKNWKEETDPTKKQKLMTTLKKKQEIRNELESQKEKLASKMV